MQKIDFNKTNFLCSVAKLAQLPEPDGYEIAFIGRSNSGKSSAINFLTQQKNLAKTSKTPGRTQCLNFFAVQSEPKLYLVDLPGYGYAKVPLAVKSKWERLIASYLNLRTNLKGLIILMDIRHPLKAIDWQVLEMAIAANLKIHIVLTKADKLKTRNKMQQALFKVKKELAACFDFTALNLSVQYLSVNNNLNKDILANIINYWLDTVS